MNKICVSTRLMASIPKHGFNRFIPRLNKSSWSAVKTNHACFSTDSTDESSNVHPKISQKKKDYKAEYYHVEYSENTVLRQCAKFESIIKNSIYEIEIENNPAKRSELCMILLGEVKMLAIDADNNETLIRSNESIGNQLFTAKQSAAKLEFLLLYRNKVMVIEKHYVVGMPSNDVEFLATFRKCKNHKGHGFELLEDGQILGKKHFKNWFWLLNFGDEKNFTQLKILRELLNENIIEYRWFADKMQAMFEVLSEDSQSEGRLFDVKYIVKKDVRSYFDFLSPDSRAAAEIFFKSEGWI